MQHGERIALAGRILSRFQTLPASQRIAYLTQAGYPPLFVQHYGEESSAATLLEHADDATLIAVIEQLEATPYIPFNQEEQGWQWGKLRLFMSHVSREKVYAHEVADALADLGVSSFVAHDDITTTEEWALVIEKRLRTCDALAAFITPEFPNSPWTDQETGYCLFRGVLIIPIRLGRDPYGFVARYQGLSGDGSNKYRLSCGTSAHSGIQAQDKPANGSSSCTWARRGV